MDEVMKKLKEHDALFVKIDQRFDQVDQRFDKMDQRFDKMDQRFVKVEGRIDQLDKRFDSLAITVIDHTERLDRIEEKMVTKADHQEVMNTLDEILALAKKKDQELAMMSHGMMRMNDDIERIKPLVGLA